MTGRRDPESLIFLPTTHEELTARQKEIARLSQVAEAEIEAILDEKVKQSIRDIMKLKDMRLRPDGSYLTEDGQVVWLTTKGVYTGDHLIIIDDESSRKIATGVLSNIGILDYLPITESMKQRQEDLRLKEQAAWKQVSSEMHEHLSKITETEILALQESGYYLTYASGYAGQYYLTRDGLYLGHHLLSYEDNSRVSIRDNRTLCIADMIPISDEQVALVNDVKQRIGDGGERLYKRARHLQ
jgi:hypothetical protein